jgi:hypothetical protein
VWLRSRLLACSGAYAGSYVASKVGMYDLYVVLLGQPVGHSPYSIAVKPGIVSAKMSAASGSVRTAHVGRPTVVLVEALDALGNKVLPDTLTRTHMHTCTHTATRFPTHTRRHSHTPTRAHARTPAHSCSGTGAAWWR